MRVMILAAGLGKRMQSLTAEIPKPLLEVGGKSLIVHQVERLVAGGVTGVVINHFYLGEKIQEALGDGSRYGIEIAYSKKALVAYADCWTNPELHCVIFTTIPPSPIYFFKHS